MKRLALLSLLAATPALAEDDTVTLKPGAGLEKVSNTCGLCHGLEYIQMNSPFLTADAWKAEVGKMRNAFGAPVTDADATAILAYLTANYGAASQ